MVVSCARLHPCTLTSCGHGRCLACTSWSCGAVQIRGRSGVALAGCHCPSLCCRHAATWSLRRACLCGALSRAPGAPARRRRGCRLAHRAAPRGGSGGVRQARVCGQGLGHGGREHARARAAGCWRAHRVRRLDGADAQAELPRPQRYARVSSTSCQRASCTDAHFASTSATACSRKHGA